jgi:hypothetical protein
LEAPQPESLPRITPVRRVLSRIGCGLIVLGAALGIFGPLRSPLFRHRLEHFLMDPSSGPPRWYFAVPLIGIALVVVGAVAFKLATHGHTDPDDESDSEQHSETDASTEDS